MAIRNSTEQVLTDTIFTYFNTSTDIVSLSSKTYYNQILPTGTIINSVQTSAIRSFTESSTNGIICDVASGSSTSATFETISVFSQYKNLISNLTSSTAPWYIASSSLINPCTRLTAISFKKSLIGNAISMYNVNGRLNFRITGSSDYYHIVQKSTYFPSTIFNVHPTMFSNNVGIIIKTGSSLSNDNISTIGNLTSSNFAGLFFGQLGLILLDQSNAASGSNFFAGTPIQFNHLYNEEYINSRTYFCRVTHEKYNFSNNPSWKVYSDGRWLKRQGIQYVAINSVGLYNDAGQLLAIGKLSYPAIKSQNREVHIQVVLRY